MNEQENTPVGIKVDLYETVVQQEESQQQKVDVKETLMGFFDSFIEARKGDLTEDQITRLVRLRSRVEIELKDIGF